MILYRTAPLMCPPCINIRSTRDFLAICDRLSRDYEEYISILVQDARDVLLHKDLTRIVMQYTLETPLMLAVMRNLTHCPQGLHNTFKIHAPVEYNGYEYPETLVSFSVYPEHHKSDVLIYVQCTSPGKYKYIVPLYESFLALCDLPTVSLSPSLVAVLRDARTALLKALNTDPKYMSADHHITIPST